MENLCPDKSKKEVNESLL